MTAQANTPCNPKRRAFQSLFAPKSGKPGPDGWFHLRGIHLIAGASGAGKTTWLIKQMRKWRNGESILDRQPCFNGEYLYVVLDRDDEDIERTAAQMGLDVSDLHVFLIPEKHEDSPLDVVLGNLLTAIEQKKTRIGGEFLENVRVVIIEGLDMGMRSGDTSDSTAVKVYLRKLRQVARKHNVAIIGTVGSPKMKPRDKYENARDRINGTHFWSRLSGMVVIIEVEPNDDDVRWMHFIPRHGKPEKYRYEWKNGSLEYSPPGNNVGQQNTSDRRIMAWAPLTGTFTPKEVCRALSLEDSTVNSALQKLVSNQELVRIKQGVYQRASKAQPDAVTAPVDANAAAPDADDPVADQPNPAAVAVKADDL